MLSRFFGILAVLRSAATMEKFASIADLPAEANALAWATRSIHWQSYRPSKRGQPKKFRYREPLILSGHGIRLRVDHGTLLIRNGFTHYPQKADEIRLFPGDANLPDRMIILDGKGGISFDALNWMSDQEIILVQLNWKGEINNHGGKLGFCADPKLVEGQRATKIGNKAPRIASWLIGEKIAACISVLENQFPEGEIRNSAISRHKRRLAEIKERRNSISISQLLGIEGDCAQSYFQSWRGLPIKWAGRNKRAIPPNWSEIAPRTKTWRRGPKFAQHPVNAMLNYGYGMLIHQVQIQTVAVGLDPSIGIVHGNKTNSIPLVYDLMEPLRPVVDQEILKFALSHTFMPGDFVINRTGNCRLNPQMAKVVAELISETKAAEIVRTFRDLI
jgi:CRISP-associated protein Cas1